MSFRARMGSWRACLPVLSIISAGCLGQRTVLRNYYVLDVPPVEAKSKRHLDGLVRVRTLDADDVYDKFQIVVRHSPYELRYSDLSVWAVKPSQMLSDILAHALEDSGAATAVTRELTDHRPAYSIAGALQAIEVLERDDHWTAHLSFSLWLVRSATGERVWSYRYEDRKPVSQASYAQAAQVLSEILQAGVKDFLDKLDSATEAEASRMKATGGEHPSSKANDLD